MAVTKLLWHGVPALAVQAPDGARAVVTLHGGHVVSWVPSGSASDEQLYLSPRSSFTSGQAIRGGVPVVFPQFSDRGPLPRHGFARTRSWRLVASRDAADGAAMLVLRLSDDDQTRAIWPHGFALELQLRLQGAALHIGLECRNTGSTDWRFSAALHSYLRVHDHETASVAGLGGHRYLDALDQQDKVQRVALLPIRGEVDRVYAGVDQPLQLRDGGAGAPRAVQVAQTGFDDVVVWNPGAVRCAALADMPADGYRRMVCIEAARITRPVTLALGQTWSGEQQLRVTDAVAP
jgi:glucose-6-phosphate 1-epimerase